MHPRRVVHMRALFTHIRAGWQRHVIVENVGLGGARIVVERPLVPGDVVSLALTAPTLWDPLTLRGRVVWAGPNEAVDAGADPLLVRPAREALTARTSPGPRRTDAASSVPRAGSHGVIATYVAGIAFDVANGEAALALCELVIALPDAS